MEWTQNQKINMQLLLDDLGARAAALRKKKRLERMEKGEAVPQQDRKLNPKSAEQHLEQFFMKVLIGQNHECWNWKACLKPEGYGDLRILGIPLYAHRIAFFLAYGYFPPDETCHSCDNRKCVNPHHLRAGTSKDNTQDCLSRGRTNRARGERAGKAKLTTAQVLEIRELRKTRLTTRAIGALFGVTHQSIEAILSRQTWKHV